MMRRRQPSGRDGRRRGGPRALVLVLSMLATGCAGSGGTVRSTKSYAFWPAYPAEPRMQFLVSYRYSDDIEPGASALEELIFGDETKVLPIKKPYGVAMWNGRIYVCDTRNAAVVVLDLRAQETRLMGVRGMGRLTNPTDVAVAPDGVKYVSDRLRGVIFVYDAEERHRATFGFEGFKPTGVAVHENELFACDFESQQVQVLDRHTGERLRAIGSPGDQDGQFVRPLGIDVDSAGNLYVSDVIRCVVQRFSREGLFLESFGQPGDTLGSFIRPKHVAVDGAGVVYVVDAGFQNVQMFDASSDLLMFFGAMGPHPGSMMLPAGIAIQEGDLDLFDDYTHPAFQAERLVLVTNQFGTNKVSVYAMGHLREGRTIQDITVARARVDEGMQQPGESGGLSEFLMPTPASSEPAEDDGGAGDGG